MDGPAASATKLSLDRILSRGVSVPQYIQISTLFCFLSHKLSSLCIFYRWSHSTWPLLYCYLLLLKLSGPPPFGAHKNDHSLVASSIFCNADTSLGITLIMSSLSSPCMNCSVSPLSYSLYSHITGHLCNLPIHSFSATCNTVVTALFH